MSAPSPTDWLSPDRLRALGASYGLPAPVGAGRTLCIVARTDDPWAARLSLPRAHAVTLHGHTSVAALAEQTADSSRFDYIIATGIFATLPRPERVAFLSAAARLLTPAGMLAIDYPAYPGGHLRAMVWDSVRSYSEAFALPAEQVRAARRLLACLAAHLPCDQERSDRRDVYALVVRAEYARCVHMSDGALLRERSDEQPTPLHIHEVVAEAERAGLQLVGEACPEPRRADATSPLDAALTAQLCHGRADIELCHDLVRGTVERQTVLCHAAVALPHTLPEPAAHNQECLG